ncbi:uncharacterized protein LOC132169472 [Corylus avellana]|uniref:uncharacterized protein LOC132169472 n=1 Tax=Corylus avellana TaxID=13451 RepID=UPI00286CDB1E|nr:uncharacterized protein LOC132169472 [Corylus avellana]
MRRRRPEPPPVEQEELSGNESEVDPLEPQSHHLPQPQSEPQPAQSNKTTDKSEGPLHLNGKEKREKRGERKKALCPEPVPVPLLEPEPGADAALPMLEPEPEAVQPERESGAEATSPEEAAATEIE